MKRKGLYLGPVLEGIESASDLEKQLSYERTTTNPRESIIECIDNSLVDICESRTNVSGHDSPNDTEVVSVVRYTGS